MLKLLLGYHIQQAVTYVHQHRDETRLALKPLVSFGEFIEMESLLGEEKGSKCSSLQIQTSGSLCMACFLQLPTCISVFNLTSEERPTHI